MEPSVARVRGANPPFSSVSGRLRRNDARAAAEYPFLELAGDHNEKEIRETTNRLPNHADL